MAITLAVQCEALASRHYRISLCGMNEFSAAWLRLREAVDLRSRNGAVAEALGQSFASSSRVRVMDIGCGTGSNLRATAPSLGSDQEWTLLDNDVALLNLASQTLGHWADKANTYPGRLMLGKGGKQITVRFRQVDAAADPGGLLGDGADLVTASAFFDLTSERFIRAFAASVIQQGAAFHSVLTFDGRQSWSPGHAADASVHAAFNVHQATDKGFGPAAGPQASAILGQVFATAGYRTVTGDSAWHLASEDRALMEELNHAVAAAAAETGLVEPSTIAGWLAWRRSRAIVGHCDILALPPG